MPPPIPPNTYQARSIPLFLRVAGILSCILPLVAFALAAMSGFLPNSLAGARTISNPIVGAIIALLTVAGVTLGITGLAIAPKYSPKNIFGLALLGTILNGIVVFTAGFLMMGKIGKNTESITKILRQSREINDATRRDLTSNNATNRIDSQKKLEGLQKSMQDAAQNMSGDDALVMSASADYMGEVAQLTKEMDAATSELTAAKIMVARGITNATQLEERRKVVQRFLKANEALKDFFQHGAENFTEQLTRAHVSSWKQAATLKGYHSKADVINPLTVEVRTCEDRIGQAMLGVIGLEENHWGKWSIKEGTGKMVFQEDGLADQYNAFLAEIRSASADEKRAGAKMAASQALQ